MSFETDVETAISSIESGAVSEGLQTLDQLESNAGDEQKLQLVQVYEQLGHVQKARELIEQLLERYPDEEELILVYAEILQATDDDEMAIEWLEDIYATSENRPRALLLLADIYTAQGLDEVAENKLLEALRILPEEPVIIFALAEFYFESGAYQKCMNYYELLLQKDHELPVEQIYAHYAEALSVSGQFEQSLIYYEKGLADSRDPESLFSFALTAYRAEAYGKAIHVLEKLREIDANYGKLYRYLMQSYALEGMLDQAYEIAEDGMKIDAFDIALAYETAELAKQHADYQTAEKWLQTSLSINALHHDSLLSLAEIYYQQERYSDIISLLSVIKDDEELDPQYDWYLAVSYNAEEVFHDAKAFYEKAAPYFQEDALFLEDFAEFLLEEGEPKRAVGLFEQALLQDPSNAALEEKLQHFRDV